MLDLVDESGFFLFSGESARLEDYKCFNDPSKSTSILGTELLELKKNDKWSHEKLWLYFYRPYNLGNNIAKKQKEMISAYTEVVELARARKSFNSIAAVFFLSLSLFVIYFYSSYYLFSFSIVISVLFYVASFSLKIEIFKAADSINILNREIDYLMSQHEKMTLDRYTINEIESIFWEDIRNLEEKYLYNVDLSKEKKQFSFYRNVSLRNYNYDFFPVYPVVPSWALLQPSKGKSNYHDDTNQLLGLSLIEQDIGDKIATWRYSSRKFPIFRVWYIQFLFFHEKNLELVSFYYDFITKKIYSEEIHSFQYNHITNYSFSQEDISFMNNDEVIKKSKIPENLKSNIFGSQIKTIYLATASGSYYRCVLPDRKVTNGLDEWLKINNAEELEAIDDYSRLIEDLAFLSYKEVKSKVGKFAIKENRFS